MTSVRKFAVLFLTVVLLAGCSVSALPNQVRPDQVEPGRVESDAPERDVGAVEPPARPHRQPPANPYFYYVESQLQLRRGNLEAAADLLRNAIALDAQSLVLRRELAIIHLQQQQPRQALELLAEVLSHQPEDVDSWVLSGRIQHSLGDSDEAISTFETALQLDPRQLNLYLMLGEIYRERGDDAEARRVYQDLVTHFPDSAAGNFHLGRLYRLADDAQQARHYLRQSLALQPDLLETRFELLRLDQADASHEDIMALYQEILAIDTENVRALAELSLYLKAHQDPEADRILAELGQRSVDDFTVTRSIFQLYLEEGAYADALVLLQGMLAGAPYHSDLHYLMALAHAGLDDDAAAFAHFKEVTGTSRFYANAVMQTALRYQEQDQPDEAIDYLESARAYLDDNVDLKLYLGILYSETEQFEKAEVVLNEALALDPENARLYFRLGVVYDKLDQKDALIKALQRSLELDDQDAYTLNYLGYTYAEMGIELEEAEQLILQAMALKPDDGYITDSLGWVYYQKGLFDKALKYLKIASELLPSDPTVLEHLGDAYYQLEAFDQALHYYRRALEQEPEDPQALKEKIDGLQTRVDSL